VPFTEVVALRDGRVADDARCAPGETGVIALRGPNVSPGYTDPARDAGTFEGGWLVGGDLGHVDAHGEVFVTGRAKDVIIRSAHNIDPRRSRGAAAAPGGADGPRRSGSPTPTPRAAGRLRAAAPGASVDEATLRAFVEPLIPERPAMPRRIEFVDAMPHTAVGKVYKPALRVRATRHAFDEALEPLRGRAGRCRSTAVEHGAGTKALVSVIAPISRRDGSWTPNWPNGSARFRSRGSGCPSVSVGERHEARRGRRSVPPAIGRRGTGPAARTRGRALGSDRPRVGHFRRTRCADRPSRSEGPAARVGSAVLRRRLQRWIPSPESVRANRMLRWLARCSSGPGCGSSADGASPRARRSACSSASSCRSRRSRSPRAPRSRCAPTCRCAAVATLVTNPVTFAPVYVGAYYVGARLLGETARRGRRRGARRGADPRHPRGACGEGAGALDRRAGRVRGGRRGVSVGAGPRRLDRRGEAAGDGAGGVEADAVGTAVRPTAPAGQRRDPSPAPDPLTPRRGDRHRAVAKTDAARRPRIGRAASGFGHRPAPPRVRAASATNTRRIPTRSALSECAIRAERVVTGHPGIARRH
jgi:hypothetical protein